MIEKCVLHILHIIITKEGIFSDCLVLVVYLLLILLNKRLSSISSEVMVTLLGNTSTDFHILLGLLFTEW